MRLFEAILDANHRALAGDQSAGVRPADFEKELPVAALTCVDPRLNSLFPNVLGLPPEEFIWLRNAGNVITGSLSSTMRSLALACAVKGAREVAIIGHTDCQVCQMTAMKLLEAMKALGIERAQLPENLTEFFGMFGSETQNVIRGCDAVRRSPIIGPRVPVHGLIVDVGTGKLDWIVNGYEAPVTTASKWNEAVGSAEHTLDALKSMADFKIGDMKFPETKIGEKVIEASEWLSEKLGKLETKPPNPADPPSKVQTALNVAERIVDVAQKYWPQPEPRNQGLPPKLPVPPAAPRPRMRMRKDNH